MHGSGYQQSKADEKLLFKPICNLIITMCSVYLFDRLLIPYDLHLASTQFCFFLVGEDGQDGLPGLPGMKGEEGMPGMNGFDGPRGESFTSRKMFNINFRKIKYKLFTKR